MDSDRTCGECAAGLEQFCPNAILTYNGPDKHLGGVTHAAIPTSCSWTSALSCVFRPL